MKVKTLKTSLETYADSLGGSGKSQAAGLQKLIDLLADHERLSVETFCKRAEAGLSPGGAKTHKPAAGSKRSSAKRGQGRQKNSLKASLVNEHVTALRAASENEAAFQAVLLKLKGDKTVRVQELKAIAAEFMGLKPMATRRADIIAEIRTKWAQDRRTRHKLDLLKGAPQG